MYRFRLPVHSKSNSVLERSGDSFISRPTVALLVVDSNVPLANFQVGLLAACAARSLNNFCCAAGMFRMTPKGTPAFWPLPNVQFFASFGPSKKTLAVEKPGFSDLMCAVLMASSPAYHVSKTSFPFSIRNKSPASVSPLDSST